jgi:eukaryotic translation initiation factor 2C
MKSNNYAAEPMLRSCGITISSQLTQVQGRVLPAPKVSSLLFFNTL